MDIALQMALLRNAERLLADAEMLLAAGSHPTAASIAILCIEELGKLETGMSTQHYAKQRGALHGGVTAIIRSGLKSVGMQEDGSIVRPDHAAEMSDDAWRAFAAKQITADLMASPLIEVIRQVVALKQFVPLKNAGFYLDIDAAGAVLRAPWDMPKHDAEAAVHAARVVLADHRTRIEKIPETSGDLRLG